MTSEYKIPNDFEEEKQPQDLKDDYTFSRMTYYRLISNGFEVLDKLKDLVQESEHPRAFEVYAGMMGKISDINDRLLDMQRKKQVLESPKIYNEIKENSKQIVFNGSATEIQKLIREENEDL